MLWGKNPLRSEQGQQRFAFVEKVAKLRNLLSGGYFCRLAISVAPNPYDWQKRPEYYDIPTLCLPTHTD